MFTTEHFIWLGICTLLITVLTVVSVKKKFSFRTAAFIMAGITLASECSKIASHMEFVNGVDASEGMVIAAGALPFHLCSLLIFAFFYLPFSKEGKVRQYITSFAVPVGLTGAVLALVMATSGTSFAEHEPYQCFVYHSGMIWFALYLILTGQVDLGKKAWIRNLLSLFGLAVLMIWVNGALQVYDTNFFYVVRPPVKNLPILNLNNGWFVYFLTLCLCGLVSVTLVHLPFVLRKNGKNE